MPQKTVQLSVADNLCQLAKEFKSGDQVMSTAIRREFKQKSFNDVTRAVVYLMEVIGSRDEQFKVLQRENKDLKELLDLKAPGWEKDNEGESNDKGVAPSTEGQDGVAAAGATEDTGTGGLTTSGPAVEGVASGTAQAK